MIGWWKCNHEPAGTQPLSLLGSLVQGSLSQCSQRFHRSYQHKGWHGTVCACSPVRSCCFVRLAGQAGKNPAPPSSRLRHIRSAHLLRIQPLFPLGSTCRVCSLGLLLYVNPNTGIQAAMICLKCVFLQVLSIWLSHRDVSRFLLGVDCRCRKWGRDLAQKMKGHIPWTGCFLMKRPGEFYSHQAPHLQALEGFSSLRWAVFNKVRVS